MFWGPARLRDRLSAGRVTPFSVDRVDGASYRLSIGHEVYVSPTAEEPKGQTPSIARLEDGEAFAIPPGQFAFLLTEECVNVELNEIAFISMRAKTKYRGLVNVSGFHVDPGFEGHLIFAVYNAGPVPVHLRQGQDIFLIWFSDLSDHCGESRPPGPHQIPSDLVNGISGRLYSLAGLAERLDTVTHRLENFRVIALIAITLLITLVGIAVGIIVKMLGTCCAAPW